MSAAATAPARRRGVGVVLVSVYAVLALAAAGRSAVQIIERFDEAPVAYSLSALAAVVYVLATLALALRWTRIAWLTIGFELLGVLVVGTLTLVAPELLGGASAADAFGRQSTVWSLYGAGYLFIPLVLPVLGLLFLARERRMLRAAEASAGEV